MNGNILMPFQVILVVNQKYTLIKIVSLIPLGGISYWQK